MSISSNYPSIRPSLLLDFARSKALDPRITFTRTTTATRVNSDGLIETVDAGAPRFDHDPLTGLCKGLLIEEQRTNLLLRSDLSVNSYTQDATVTANSIASPDGTVNATLLTSTLTGGSNTCYVDRSATVTTSTTYTFSVFLKAGTSPTSTINLWFSGGTFRQVVGIINWSTLAYTVTSTDSTGTGTITNYGNGWYRLTITYDSGNNTISYSRVYVRDSGPNNVTGETVYAWGRQTEAGAFPTSYIPTTTATVTRNGDLASMTGTNFSSWFNNAEGTLYAAGYSDVLTVAGNKPRLVVLRNSLDTNFNRNSISLQRNSTALESAVYLSAVSQAYFFGAVGDLSNSRLGKAAIAYKFNDINVSCNGDIENTDTSAQIPVVDMINIGEHGFSGIGPWNGHISKVAYYPVRLTNDQLQALTR